MKRLVRVDRSSRLFYLEIIYVRVGLLHRLHFVGEYEVVVYKHLIACVIPLLTNKLFYFV